MLSAIVAICLISVSFGLAARAIKATMDITDRLMDGARSVAACHRLDSTLVNLAARVRQPFWLAQPTVAYDDASISIAYLDGDSENELSLSWRGDEVTIVSEDTRETFAGVLVKGAVVVTDPPAHLAVTVVTKPDTEITLTAPFGRFPIPIQ